MMATPEDPSQEDSASKSLLGSSSEPARRPGASMTSAGAQVTAYVAWLNARLKKKAGSRPVEDLSTDLRDGVALAHVIEVLGKEKLTNIHECPSSTAEKLANVEAVIAFMTSKRIRMHHTTAQDIVDGNLKAVMRLILALAAHFNPRSVRQSSSASSTPVKFPEQSITSIAQNAAVTLADARRDAASSVTHRPRRPRQLKKSDPRSSDTSSDSDHAQHPIRTGAQPPPPLLPRGNRRDADGAGSPRAHRRLDFGGVALPKSKSQDHMAAAAAAASEAEQAEFVRDLEEGHSGLHAQISDTRETLLRLQSLLLDGCVDGCAAEGGSPQEQLVVLRSRLQQAEEAGRAAREDLSRVTQECLQLQGSKTALEKRLREQEEAFLAMKSDLLRAGFCRQGLETTKDDLQAKLEDKDLLLMDLRRELSRKEREIDELKTNFRLYQQEKEATAHDLRTQIQELHGRLQRVGDTELALSARMAAQDRKMGRLEGRLLQDAAPGAPGPAPQAASPVRPPSARSIHSASSDELQLVRESLRSLRAHTSRLGDDSGQHSAIDTIEASIAALVEKLQVSAIEHSRLSDSSQRNYDSTGDYRRSPITSLPGYASQRLDHELSNGSTTQTKVLYFTDRTVTPFMCTVQKRIDEVRLRDIKALFDRHHNHRFHFKAQDPEFGTVKEEINHDDALVPSWDGKIIAWIEEDHD